jgi:hypothetical protein
LRKIGIEVVKFSEEVEGAVRVVDGRTNLAAVADDTGVADEALDIGIIELCDLMEIESGERCAEVFALSQDGKPGESGLKSLEADFFEEAKIVGHSPAPFLVMVADVFFIVTAPPAPDPPIGTGHETIFWELH